MAQTAPIVDSQGRESRLKLKRIAEFEKAGAGQWIGSVFHFTRRAESQSAQRHSPNIGRITSRLVEQHDGSDSGQFGFLRYPMKTGESGGFAAQYPALSRRRAGL